MQGTLAHGNALPGHAGTIQQAVVLQADRVDIAAAEISVMGFDGQLPKLDTYETLRHLLYVLWPVELKPLSTSKVVDDLLAMLQSTQQVKLLMQCTVYIRRNRYVTWLPRVCGQGWSHGVTLQATQGRHTGREQPVLQTCF